MQDLVQSQIQDSCRLALPNGLKELMSDISREVLRAQPQNLLKFISDYLSALLITRENLYIAEQVYKHICSCDCRPALEDELKLFLDETMVTDVAEIVMKIMLEGTANEENLLRKLLSKNIIEERHLPAVITAVRNAFRNHNRNQLQMDESSSSSTVEESGRPVKHTSKQNREVELSQETFNSMSQKIQTTSKSHKVRLDTGTTINRETQRLMEKSPSESIVSLKESLDKAKVTFGTIDRVKTETENNSHKYNTAHKKRFPTVTELSSTSLAGSYLSVPKYRPSAHNIDILEEYPEKERSNFDYTKDSAIEVDINEKTNENELKDNSDRDISEVSEESESFEETDSVAGEVLAPIKERDDLMEIVEEINKPTEVRLMEQGEIDENIVEENAIEEKIEVEENITVEEDVMEDIPEDINGSY